MNFSILLPTRERTELLHSLLESIQKTTLDLTRTEVLIACDSDDYPTLQYLEENTFPFVKPFYVQRSLNFSRDYYTFLAKQSTGKWLIAANDDCIFETLHWDKIAHDILKDKPGVVYGWIEDGIDSFRATQGHGYCCFPLQGRKGFEALGYIFPSRIPTWGADFWAKNLYDKVGSVVKLPIMLRHYCYHNKTRVQDGVSKRIQNNQVAIDVNPTAEEVRVLKAACS